MCYLFLLLLGVLRPHFVTIWKLLINFWLILSGPLQYANLEAIKAWIIVWVSKKDFAAGQMAPALNWAVYTVVWNWHYVIRGKGLCYYLLLRGNLQPPECTVLHLTNKHSRWWALRSLWNRKQQSSRIVTNNIVLHVNSPIKYVHEILLCRKYTESWLIFD